MDNPSAYQIGQVIGASMGILIGFIGLGLMVFSLVAVIMAFLKRTRGWIIAACISSWLAVSLVGIGAAYGWYAYQQATMPKKLTSSDGKASLVVPGSWIPMASSNPIARMQVGNTFRGQYMLVITEAKSAIPWATLDTYTNVVLSKMEKNTKGKHGDIETLTVHGLPARRTRLVGKSKNLDIVYSVTTLSDGDHFHQLVGWTLADRESVAMPVLKETADTFEYTAAPAKSDEKP